MRLHTDIAGAEVNGGAAHRCLIACGAGAGRAASICISLAVQHIRRWRNGVGARASLGVSNRPSRCIALATTHGDAHVTGKCKDVTVGTRIQGQARCSDRPARHACQGALANQIDRGRPHARELALGGAQACRDTHDIGAAQCIHRHITAGRHVAIEFRAVGALDAVLHERQAHTGRTVAQTHAHRTSHANDAIATRRSLEFVGVAISGTGHLVIGHGRSPLRTDQIVQRTVHGGPARLQKEVARQVDRGAPVDARRDRVVDLVVYKSTHQLAF